VILGFIQAATEKEGVVKDFLQGLIERGFHLEQGLLWKVGKAKFALDTQGRNPLYSVPENRSSYHLTNISLVSLHERNHINIGK